MFVLYVFEYIIEICKFNYNTTYELWFYYLITYNYL